MRGFSDLKLTSRKPLTAKRIEAAVGSDCLIWKEDQSGYDWYTITAAAATEDPCKADIEIQPKRVWAFGR